MYYPYNCLTLNAINSLYIPEKNIDVFLTGFSYEDNHITGYITVDNNKIYVTGYYIYSSMAYGPHFALQIHFDKYLPMLKNNKLTWEEYTKLSSLI